MQVNVNISKSSISSIINFVDIQGQTKHQAHATCGQGYGVQIKSLVLASAFGFFSSVVNMVFNGVITSKMESGCT